MRTRDCFRALRERDARRIGLLHFLNCGNGREPVAYPLKEKPPHPPFG